MKAFTQMKENGLEIVEVILESSARLVVNRASYQTKRTEVLKFVETLNQITSCAFST
jgi:ATP phosphoribosyltransferase